MGFIKVLAFIVIGHLILVEAHWGDINEIRLSEKEDDENVPVPGKDDERGIDSADDIIGIPLNTEDREDEIEERNIYTEFTRQLDRYLRGKNKKGGKKAKKPSSSKNGSPSSSTSSSSDPVSCGMDMEELKDSHPGKRLRPGQATETDSCSKVRSVPSNLRSSANMYPDGIHKFYTKYTETYGIPIIGSSDVSDEGLMRACYLVRFFLCGRYDMRNAYYKLWGMVAIIGDHEQTTSLPQYSGMSKTLDTRTRGVGPTTTKPVTSAGDDNSCCKPGDRYFDQDILAHEFVHACHQMGATLVMPGFEEKLGDAYDKYVTKEGKWKGTYAATNRNEYLATAAQMYFNAFRSPGKYLSSYGVSDRVSLKKYDPSIVKLLDEMFPCSVKDNILIQRCDWKKCDVNNFVLLHDSSVKAVCGCTNIKSITVKDVNGCAHSTCYNQGNAFNYRGTTCQVLKCTNGDMKLSQPGGAGFDIYKAKAETVMTLQAEASQKLKVECTKGDILPGTCDKANTNNPCGPPTTTSETCGKRGCCWISNKCYYPNRACVNSYIDCPEMARDKECRRNPGYMLRICPLACNVCNHIQKISVADLTKMCQDKSPHCPQWASKGDCKINKSYMEGSCALSCKVCTPPKYPF